MPALRFGPTNPAATYVAHDFEEQIFDAGEVRINYVVAGDPAAPALLLIPGQTESWWGYQRALPLLAEHFRAYAVDLRGQGRSTWTPGRYTLDNFGNDLVRFMAFVISRPAVVSGLSSGGVLSAWLSAYALPGQVRGAHYEDPPLFASEMNPAYGQSIRQAIGPMFALMSKYLGDQWSIGDWEGMVKAAPAELPLHLAQRVGGMGQGGGPPQNLKEYDPEWARAFWTGTVGASCDHARMLASVRVPVLFTHHFRTIDADGRLLGAVSDMQAERVCAIVRGTGQPLDYQSFPKMGHSMHGQDPALFTRTLVEWVANLPADARS